MPPSLKNGPDGKKGTLQVPGSTGGGNWNSGAADAETGIFYVTSKSDPSLIALAKSPTSDMDFVNMGGGLRGPQGLPLVKPPWGRVTAIDMNTGEHLWMVPNGETPEAVKNSPALEGVNLPKTGNTVLGGLLVTKTLLFVGANRHIFGEPILQALDKHTGERVAAINLPGVATGVPMTYMLNGNQYIVVAVGSKDHPAELVALGLASAQVARPQGGGD